MNNFVIEKLNIASSQLIDDDNSKFKQITSKIKEKYEYLKIGIQSIKCESSDYNKVVTDISSNKVAKFIVEKDINETMILEQIKK